MEEVGKLEEFFYFSSVLWLLMWFILNEERYFLFSMIENMFRKSSEKITLGRFSTLQFSVNDLLLMYYLMLMKFSLNWVFQAPPKGILTICKNNRVMTRGGGGRTRYLPATFFFHVLQTAKRNIALYTNFYDYLILLTLFKNKNYRQKVGLLKNLKPCWGNRLSIRREKFSNSNISLAIPGSDMSLRY